MPGRGWLPSASCLSQGEGKGPNHGFLRTAFILAQCEGLCKHLSCSLSPFPRVRRSKEDVSRSPSCLQESNLPSVKLLSPLQSVFFWRQGLWDHRSLCAMPAGGSGKPGAQAGQACRQEAGPASPWLRPGALVPMSLVPQQMEVSPEGRSYAIPEALTGAYHGLLWNSETHGNS